MSEQDRFLLFYEVLKTIKITSYDVFGQPVPGKPEFYTTLAAMVLSKRYDEVSIEERKTMIQAVSIANYPIDFVRIN